MFKPFRKQSQKPTKPSAQPPKQYLSEAMRDVVWGDLPWERWAPDDATGYPWDLFLEARKLASAGQNDSAIDRLLKIANAPNLESRHYLQAWHFLRQLNHPVPDERKNIVYAVIVEAAMPTGLDLMVAYHDYHARFYSHAGGGTIWERPDAQLDQPIQVLLKVAQQVADVIGTEPKQRPPLPTRGEMRFSLLTPAGMGYAQGTQEMMMQDTMGKALMVTSVNLLNEITRITIAMNAKKQ